MKKYQITDLQGDSYLNPAPPETRPVGNITRIVVHHSAVQRPHDYDSAARYRSEAAEHYARLGPGLQYHYVIDNTGEIFSVRPHTATLWHASNLAVNRTSIAICLDGYFHPPVNQQPTLEQCEALNQLLDNLCLEHPEFPASIGDVYGHREVTLPGMGTACPGDNMINRVIGYRSGGHIDTSNTSYDWPDYQDTTPPPTPPTPAPMPPSVEINYRVIKDSKQVGAYKLDQNAWNKYKTVNGSLIVDGTGRDVTQRLKDKFEPEVILPPVAPPAKQDELVALGIKENTSLLKQILSLIQWIVNKLKGVK